MGLFCVAVDENSYIICFLRWNSGPRSHRARCSTQSHADSRRASVSLWECGPVARASGRWLAI